MDKRRIRFGVNYVPSKKWWFSWIDWDKNSILEDLRAISGLGMDHIRIHCLWPVFQPGPNFVSELMLDRLRCLLDLAEECNLDVQVTVLDGWLSGLECTPFWQRDRNMFTDKEMIKAEKLLFCEIARSVGKHPRFMGFDLGNELTVMQYLGNPVTVEEGDEWQAEMLGLCQELLPDKFHVNGIDHVSWFVDKGFSRKSLSSIGSATSLHTWVEFTGALSNYKPMESGSVHLIEYNIELAKAYSNPQNRPIWIQEFGATKCWMENDEIPDFAEKSISNAASCDCLWGFTWWCSHDINTNISGFGDIEYDMGLLNTNNTVKPVGERISQLIKKYKSNPPELITRSIALVFPDNLFSEDKIDYVYPNNPGWKFAKPYMDLIEKGIRPAIVLESQSGDEDYLNSRGIKELIRII